MKTVQDAKKLCLLGKNMALVNDILATTTLLTFVVIQYGRYNMADIHQFHCLFF